MYVLGIDASTTCTAVVLLENASKYDPKLHVVHYEPITFSSCKTFWEKCDLIRDKLINLSSSFKSLDAFFIEEPMKRFAQGFSSAETISTLQRFNGIVCYIVRDIWHVDVTYINVASARKATGVRVQSKTKIGKSSKQQTFEHMSANDLSHVQWVTKKNGAPKDFCFDIVDAYVVARGGMILHL
jgi:hypothetical protein